jgi:hypothetical protein
MLDGAGKIVGADWVEAVDDGEAMRHAHGHVQAQGRTYELWDRKRLVGRKRQAPDGSA